MNVAGVFQQNNFLQKNLATPRKSALGSALAQINEKIHQNLNAKSDVKIQRDIYIPKANSEYQAFLDKFSDADVEIMDIVFHRCKFYNLVDSDIEDFREQLKGIDQTIEEYEKFLNGEIDVLTKPSDGLYSVLGTREVMSRQEVQTLLEETKAFREEFVRQKVKTINNNAAAMSDYVGAGSLEEQWLERIFGQNPLAGLEKSDWAIDLKSADIYAELDKVQNAAAATCNVLSDCADMVKNEMIKRNLAQYGSYEDYFATKQAEPDNSAKVYENMLQLELERLAEKFVAERK